MNFIERGFDHQNQWWKYAIILIVGVFGGQLLGSIPLVIVMMVNAATSGGAMIFNPENMADFTMLGISKNVGLLLILLPFVVTLIITVWLINVVHKRTFNETVNGTNRLRFGRIRDGFGVWIALMSIYFIGDYAINPENFVLQFDLTKFILLLFISLLLIPLQTTCEEIILRGYLTQGIAIFTRSRLLAIILPGIIFGLLHSSNPEVKEYGFALAMTQYITFGLLFGLVSVLDDGIEIALGMHAANNIFLSLFLTYKSSIFQTDAVFEQLNLNPIKDAVSLIVMGIIAFIYFAYKYKWNFGILTKKIIIEQELNNQL